MAQTRLQLRTRARTRADQTNSTKPTDTEYNAFIDEGARQVWGELVQGGWPVDYTQQSITANGAATYVIGSGINIFGVNGVFYANGADTYELKRVNQGDVAALKNSLVQGNRATYYEIRISPTLGFIIEIYPRPNGGIYLVNYTPDFDAFADDSAIWYGPARSDELIVLSAAAKGLRNEGMDRDAWVIEQEREKMLALVMNQASWVDQRNSAMIRDSRWQRSQLDPAAYPVTPGLGDW